MKIYNSKLDRIVYKINALLLCAVVISVYTHLCIY